MKSFRLPFNECNHRVICCGVSSVMHVSKHTVMLRVIATAATLNVAIPNDEADDLL